MTDQATLAKSRTLTPLTLPTWAVSVPAVTMLAFLTLLGRAGVGIQLFGLPLGAYLTPVPTSLVGLLLVSRRGRLVLHTLATDSFPAPDHLRHRDRSWVDYSPNSRTGYV